ncbi:unnamed protein product [Caenorhabditis sp. 36 PRJEB53466]|nr:unnamed protein product [Caenorhabditis sp. 36 PRJEB53466]
MVFERKLATKLDLSKIIHNMSTNDGVDSERKSWLELKKFRLSFLALQDAARTERLYQDADGRNVLATFERIRREIEDIQYLSMLKPRLRVQPVVSYNRSSSHKTRGGKIEFTTRKNRMVTVVLTLKDQPLPASQAFSNSKRSQLIKLEVNVKFSPENGARLKEQFNQALHAGKLFLDFITDCLWPILDAQDKLDREKLIQEKEMKEKKLSENQMAVEKTTAQLKKMEMKKPEKSGAGREPRESRAPCRLMDVPQFDKTRLPPAHLPGINNDRNGFRGTARTSNDSRNGSGGPSVAGGAFTSSGAGRVPTGNKGPDRPGAGFGAPNRNYQNHNHESEGLGRRGAPRGRGSEANNWRRLHNAGRS